MALFGIEKWCARGDTSVYFKMFARLAPLEVRDIAAATAVRDRLGGGAGLGRPDPDHDCKAIFGAQEGLLNGAIGDGSTRYRMTEIGLSRPCAAADQHAVHGADPGRRHGDLLGRRAGDGHRGKQGLEAADLGRVFAHSFIPIGLAYLFAHYFSLVLFQEQAQFTYLLSDPLGEGSNFFGTAGSGIDYGLIGAEAVWYVQVAALVVGHVAALAMGHDKAWTSTATCAALRNPSTGCRVDGELHRARPDAPLERQRLTALVAPRRLPCFTLPTHAPAPRPGGSPDALAAKADPARLPDGSGGARAGCGCRRRPQADRLRGGDRRARRRQRRVRKGALHSARALRRR